MTFLLMYYLISCVSHKDMFATYCKLESHFLMIEDIGIRDMSDVFLMK